MFKFLKQLFSSSSSDSGVTTKEKATARNEPYVNVVKVNIDKDKPSDGYFELEWNQVFIRQLMDAGYSGDNEEEIIDQWFTALCSSVASSEY
jgi:hypothetical protein|tara:strand:+ start:2274 stop:2549 length:276 start_codon:yes stop_codon:yes gene_type:complete